MNSIQNTVLNAAYFGFFAGQFTYGSHMLLVGATELVTHQNNGHSRVRSFVSLVFGAVNVAFGCVGMYVCNEPETLLSHRNIQ